MGKGSFGYHHWSDEFCKSVAMRDRADRKYWQMSFRNANTKVIYTREDDYTYYEKYDLVEDPLEQSTEMLSGSD